MDGGCGGDEARLQLLPAEGLRHPFAFLFFAPFSMWSRPPLLSSLDFLSALSVLIPDSQSIFPIALTYMGERSEIYFLVAYGRQTPTTFSVDRNVVEKTSLFTIKLLKSIRCWTT